KGSERKVHRLLVLSPLEMRKRKDTRWLPEEGFFRLVVVGSSRPRLRIRPSLLGNLLEVVGVPS
ncbi:MAG: hypothetical protein J5965_11860, partial [Aeriscardovia sp.]|nr:hypothetical protein [Aeriscardovia sp.]